jgi:hypothetical protein
MAISLHHQNYKHSTAPAVTRIPASRIVKRRFTVSFITLAVLMITLTLQGEHNTQNACVDQHFQSVMGEIPPDSALRHEHLSGARGVGLHYPSMDDMKKEGIKRAPILFGE